MAPQFAGLSLPPLPPGSALRFSASSGGRGGGGGGGSGDSEQRFPSLLQNLEGEMSRLLEWASTGDIGGGGGRSRARAPHGASQRGGGGGGGGSGGMIGVGGGSGVGASHAYPQPIANVTTAEVRQEEVRDFLKERADVHQRRAKRREIAESTAVRLPREITAGRTRRGGKDREVSYLSDGGHAAPHASSVPASVIPDAFRIVMESPFPTKEPHFYSVFGEENWAYNDATRKFEAVLFPSKVRARRGAGARAHAAHLHLPTRRTCLPMRRTCTCPKPAPRGELAGERTRPCRRRGATCGALASCGERPTRRP